MKYIFTIATNIYIEYFENFKNSINNFYTNEDKTLIVFSNKLQEYNNCQEGKTKIKIISIPNLLYTSILLNKFNFIEWYCENNNIKENEIIYYFDIDTLFYNNELGQEYLQNIINENKDKVIFSEHPISLINKNLNSYIFCHGYLQNFGDNNTPQSKVLNDYSYTTPIYLLNYDIITSFFAGTLQSIKTLNIKYTEIYKDIMHNDKVVSNYYDEDICNYILLKELRNEYDVEYIYKNTNEFNLININSIDLNNIMQCCFLGQTFNINNEHSKYLICNQKYNVNRKQITK